MDKLLLIGLSVLGQVYALRMKSKFSIVTYDYNMVGEVCDQLLSDVNIDTANKAVLANNRPGKFIVIKFLL